MEKETPKFNVDIDKDRIQEIVLEAIRIINEYFSKDKPLIDNVAIMSQLRAILSTGRVSTDFYLNLPNPEYSDLILKIDPRRKRILCKSRRFRKKVAKINHFIKAL